MKIKSIMAVAMLLLSSLMSCEEDNSNVTYSPNDESKMTELPDSMWNKINSQDTVLNACSEKINGLVASQNESNDKIAEIQKRIDEINEPGSVWNILIIISLVSGLSGFGLALLIKNSSLDIHSVENKILGSERFKELKDKVDSLSSCNNKVNSMPLSKKDNDLYIRVQNLERRLNEIERSNLSGPQSGMPSAGPMPLQPKVLYVKNVSGKIITGTTDSQQDDSIFKLTLTASNAGTLNVITLQKIQQRNGLENVIDYVGSCELSEAKDYKLERPGTCQKVDGYWKVTEKLIIRIY